MRNSRESVHGDGSRGSGRTYRQVESLRETDLFIVHNPGMLSHARTMAYKLGKPKLKIVIFWDRDFSSPVKVQGMPLDCWIEVDHASEHKMSSALREYVDAHNRMVSE